MSTFPYVAGEWYVVITCERCKSRQPIFHDLTDGKANINAIYTWRCSECGHKGIYEGEAVELYQHPATATAGHGNGST
jgi:predicted nucleic-acid-binding Zn-ribbon protein